MADRDELQHQDDELDVEELEQASGGFGEVQADNNTGCGPNTNCPCSPQAPALENG